MAAWPAAVDARPEHRTIETCIAPLAAEGLRVDKILGLSVMFDNQGKPMLPVLPPASARLNEAERCLPALPCGSRLLGEVRKNGAVEVQMPALRW